MFYTCSYNKGWMSFIKRFDAGPVCHSKPLDSLKNWNDHFFWVDSTAFPFSVSLKRKILNKDPPPKLPQYDTQACDFLRTHIALFENFQNLFILEMALFAFIRHSDPTKVVIRERNLFRFGLRFILFHIFGLRSGPVRLKCQEGLKSYIDDIATATKPHLDKARKTLASCMKEAVIAYQNMRLTAGVKVLRDNQIIHRDLIQSLQQRGLIETLCCSPLYMAPEITQLHKYDAKSVGSISFQLVTSENTFHWNNQIQATVLLALPVLIMLKYLCA
nr:hypothetical protein [Tanacetum cinerariifolium]